MTIDELQGSIDSLVEKMVETSAEHIEERGLAFDKDRFLQAMKPMVEFVAETAHFEGGDALSEI